MSDEQKRVLEKALWNIANLLRGKMNAGEYKNYILGFIEIVYNSLTAILNFTRNLKFYLIFSQRKL